MVKDNYNQINLSIFFKEWLIIKKLPQIGPAILPHLKVNVPKMILALCHSTENFYGDMWYNG